MKKLILSLLFGTLALPLVAQLMTAQQKGTHGERNDVYTDSTFYGEEWCDYCYKNLYSVDFVFHENILYMNDILGTREEYRLECSEDNKRCRELIEFLWVVTLMSDRNFIGQNPHETPQIERNRIKELEQWYNKHKHLITIDLLRRFYCSLYPPIMDMDKLEKYYDNLFDCRIVD